MVPVFILFWRLGETEKTREDPELRVHLGFERALAPSVLVERREPTVCCPFFYLCERKTTVGTVFCLPV